MFTVFLQNHAEIWKALLEHYFPYDGVKKPRGLDVTAGTKATWIEIDENPCPCCKSIHYDVVFCDRDPIWCHEDELKAKKFKEEKDKISKTKKWGKLPKEKIIQEVERRVQEWVKKSMDPLRDILVRDIDTDTYTDLGVFDFLFADFPYLIGRQNAFNYSNKPGATSHNAGLTGPKSWSASELSTYVANPTVEAFNNRIKKLNEKAAEVMKPGGLLFVKVMNVRHEGELINHVVSFINLLTNFKQIDWGIYIKTSGSTTWKIKNHLQTLNGSWLIFELIKKVEEEKSTLDSVIKKNE